MDEWTLDEQRAAAKAVALLRAQQSAPGAITRDKDGKIPYQIIALPRRTIIVNWVYRLVIIGVCLALTALIALDIRPAVQATFFASPAEESQPTAATYPTRAPRLEYGGATDTGRSAPSQPTQAPAAYPLTLPGSALAAWAPDQQPTLDVGGRRYRVVEARPGATLAELDDGAQVWLVDPAADAPVAPASAVEIAPPPGPVETWGEGGTTGGSTWGEPTAMPLQNAIIPAMPFLEAPTPTWGEGGSTGGATW
jgi:hypothetical protein